MREQSFGYMTGGEVCVDGDLLQVRFPYHPDTVTAIRGFCEDYGCPRRWKPELRAWLIPADLSDPLLKSFPRLRLVGDPPAPKHETKLLTNLLSVLPPLDQPLPDGRTPFMHQREAVKQMVASRGKLLAFDMGTGKTLCALVAAKAWQDKCRMKVLVVCFANKIEDWKEEAAGLGVWVEMYSWAKVPEPPTEPFVLIGDESHAIKTMTSQRTKGFLRLADKAQATYLLTGTPMPNGRPVELFPQLVALKHRLARDRNHYERTYCDAKRKFDRWDVNGARNMKELRTLTSDVMMRKRKDECLDLPKLTRQFIHVDPDDGTKAEYRRKFREVYLRYMERVDQGICSGDAEGAVLLSAVRQAASLAKVAHGIEMIEELLVQKQKVVIFTAFRESARRISDHFQIEPYSGESNQSVRQEVYSAFKEGRCPIFCGTGDSGGVGLNLQAASYVIMLDRSLTPGMVDQQESRCHRAGQHWPVTSYWLCYGEADDRVDRLLLSKQEKIEEFLEGRRDMIRRGTGVINPWKVLKAVFEEEELPLEAARAAG